MKLIILLSSALLLSYISHTVYAQDSAIKQKLIDLEAVVNKEPPFYFRNDMYGKLLLKQELKQIISLVEEDKLQEAKNLIDFLLIKIEDLIADSLFKETFRRELVDISIKIKEITQH